MLLKDIYFGKVDAKNELNENSDEQKKMFVETFLIPKNIDIRCFESGEKYFIYGLKGTGKTAFLRYMSIIFDKKEECSTSFILFKSDFSETDKQHFSKIASVIYDKKETALSELHDYENIWSWFFFRHIVEYTIENNLQLFQVDDNWNKFRSIMQSLKKNMFDYGRFIPKIKQGQVEINGGFGKIGIELNFSSNKIKFNDLVHLAETYFKKLSPLPNKKIYIFLDELELEYSTKKMYDRDSKMIRDLIVTVNKLNSFCRKNKYPVYFITSIRSEVLTAVEAIGKEINKSIEDFGTPISWHQAGGSLRKHPLIEIILKRLYIAEKSQGNNYTYQELWEKYFPRTIQNIPTESYILFNTWYRPRDIVRMLNLAKDTFPMESSIGHQVFDGIRKQYSSKSWTECLEELKAIYNSEQLNAITCIFNGWKKTFTFQDISRRMDEISPMYHVVEELKEIGISKMLHAFYNAGIIGNKYREDSENDQGGKKRFRFRFTFRGDEMLFLDKGMMIHNALISHFSL